MPSKLNDKQVAGFLKRIVDIANIELTPYGTLNPWKEKKVSATKKPQNYMCTLEGNLEPGMNTPYSINGCDISIGTDTMVVGDLTVGAIARVKLGKGNRAKTVVVTK
ncbi:MAG: hypothetical protein IT290_04440 [Deltaproteobacteria bacterium]|nr:hypothetical protein [Deltaproteobacteria bacterium]